MKYLVTGITGFVGPHMANKLMDEGHEVFGLYRSDNFDLEIVDKEKIKLVYGDFLDKSSLDKIFMNNKFDGVFHLGAATHPPTSFKEPRLYFKTNALGTINLCDAISMFNPEAVLMYCGTSESYGICSEGSRIDETFPLKPMNPYGVAKTAGDLYISERARNSELRAYVTRAFSHTGPRRRTNFSISSDAVQIAKILKGLQEPIIRVGNLECKRVVMDVRDVVGVYYQLMVKMHQNAISSGEVFNIGGDVLNRIGFFLDKMLELFNVKAETVIDEKLYRPIDIPAQYPDSTRVRKLLNWKPLIPIEKTLTDLVNYWLEKI